MSVGEAWERYVYQIKQVGAEAMLGLLRPGCTESEFARVEEETGYVLSEEAKELYRLHDGQEWEPREPMILIGAEIFPDAHWNSLNELIECQQSIYSNVAGFEELLEFDGDSPELASGFYHPGWLPFTASGGDHDCIDMAPTAEGQLGQIVGYSHDSFAGLVSGNLADFIDQKRLRLVMEDWQYEDETGFFPRSER